MKLVGRALNALEVLAECARNGLVDSAGRVGVVWHANSDGFSREIARFAILEARCRRVNHLRVPLCPEVQLPVSVLVGGFVSRNHLRCVRLARGGGSERLTGVLIARNIRGT